VFIRNNDNAAKIKNPTSKNILLLVFFVLVDFDLDEDTDLDPDFGLVEEVDTDLVDVLDFVEPPLTALEVVTGFEEVVFVVFEEVPFVDFELVPEADFEFVPLKLLLLLFDLVFVVVGMFF
jgi:hypothetical protein